MVLNALRFIRNNFNIYSKLYILKMFDTGVFECYMNERGYSTPESHLDLDIGYWLSDPRNRKRYFKFLEWYSDKLIIKAEPTYRYMLTFTLKPKSVHLEEKAEAYVRTQATRKALGLTYFAYVRELTKKGVPHYHAVIKSRKPIKRNRFQYYEKIFGSIDLSRTKGQTTQEALNYISKESTPIVLLDD